MVEKNTWANLDQSIKDPQPTTKFWDQCFVVIIIIVEFLVKSGYYANQYKYDILTREDPQ